MNNLYKNRHLERLDNPESYNNDIRKGWMPFWTKNAAENYQFIKEEFRKEYRDVSVLATKPHAENVLLIGSGPSLNDIEPYLKDWKGDIMCSSSQLAFFEAIGVKPTYCFIIDADPQMAFLVTEADTKDIILVSHANMDPVVLRAWKGPKYFFRMHDPGDNWFGEYMPMMYGGFMDPDTKTQWPGIQAFVLNAGNVSNTHIAVANFLGYKRAFLCGVDLGFPDGKYRFIGYTRTKDGFEREKEIPMPPGKRLKDGTNNVMTDQVCCFYKYSTYILWGMDMPNIYSCSRGILTDIPYISPKEVVDCQGNVPDTYIVPNQTKYKIAQTYLRYRGIYIMKGTSSVKKRPIKNFEKTKKRFVKLMLFSYWIRGKLNEPTKKHILKTMLPSPKLRFQLYMFQWEFDQKEVTRVWMGYTGINNKYTVKGLKRIGLMCRFTIGRWVGLW